MKKLLLGFALFAGTLGAFAQTEKGEKSIIGDLGVKSDPGRFFIGAQGRYAIVDNLRIAPDVSFVFPHSKTTGFDINLNVHYVFDVYQDVTVYPLAGLAMQNGRYSGRKEAGHTISSSTSFTDWGFNLGAGSSYNLDSKSFVNAELKYTFSDADCFSFAIGYGIKF